MTVIILAAGKGTRMGQHTAVPKCLLPYKGKAIIGHVVEAWFLTGFIVVVPQDDTMIESYLRTAYPQTDFTFVQTNDKAAPLGPLGSLQLALQILPEDEPIIFTVADGVYSMSQMLLTYIQTPDFAAVHSGEGTTIVPRPKNNNFLGVQFKAVAEQHDYLNVKEIGERLVFLEKKTGNAGYQSWSGVAAIYSTTEFRTVLDQVLSIYRHTNQEASFTVLWTKFAGLVYLGLYDQPFLDLGTEKRYEDAVRSEEKGFDYSKPDQITYTNHKTNRVVKYWTDEAEAHRWARRHANMEWNGARYILPSGVIHKGNFVSYERVAGKTLAFTGVSGHEFRVLLNTLHRQLWWTPRSRPTHEGNPSVELYFRKTLARVQAFLKQSPAPASPHLPAGWPSLLKEPFWYEVKPARVGNVHGDLTLDNIVRQPNGTITLIDWRTKVDDIASAEGDIYYDLSKLWLSIDIDLAAVKKGEFSVTAIPSVENKDELLRVLYTWCAENGFSYREVVRYAILMMAAMCAVHQQPLAGALYAKSLSMAWSFMKDIKCFDPTFKTKEPQ